MPTFDVVTTEWEYCELAEHRVRYRGEEQVIGTLSLADAVLRVPPQELILVAGRLAADGWAPVDVQVDLDGPAPADWTSRRVRFRHAVDRDSGVDQQEQPPTRPLRDRLVPGQLTRQLDAREG
jgi:hypothetical protein